jgi:hypothetical protein
MREILIKVVEPLIDRNLIVAHILPRLAGRRPRARSGLLAGFCAPHVHLGSLAAAD